MELDGPMEGPMEVQGSVSLQGRKWKSVKLCEVTCLIYIRITGRGWGGRGGGSSPFLLSHKAYLGVHRANLYQRAIRMPCHENSTSIIYLTNKIRTSYFCSHSDGFRVRTVSAELVIINTTFAGIVGREACVPSNQT